MSETSVTHEPMTNGYYWYVARHPLAKGVIVHVTGWTDLRPMVEICGEESLRSVLSMADEQWFGPLVCPLVAKTAPAGGEDFDARR